MIYTSVTNFRKNLFHMLEQAIKYNEPIHINTKAVKSIFVCKLPSGITVDNYAARRAACSSAIRCS